MQKIFGTIIKIIVLTSTVLSVQAADGDTQDLQVVIETNRGKPSFRVAGEIVELKKLLDAFDEKAQALGTKVNVDVLVEINTPFSVMFDVTGMLGKVGYQNVKCYVMDSNRRTMVEILRGRGNLSVPKLD